MIGYYVRIGEYVITLLTSVRFGGNSHSGPFSFGVRRREFRSCAFSSSRQLPVPVDESLDRNGNPRPSQGLFETNPSLLRSRLTGLPGVLYINEVLQVGSTSGREPTLGFTVSASVILHRLCVPVPIVLSRYT